ncbi:MAG: hypothetical protein HY756_04585 [Nitrospirae bacterium]|nr:hypothetical protein [Nitrospirota bacterium]
MQVEETVKNMNAFKTSIKQQELAAEYRIQETVVSIKIFFLSFPQSVERESRQLKNWMPD